MVHAKWITRVKFNKKKEKNNIILSLLVSGVDVKSIALYNKSIFPGPFILIVVAINKIHFALNCSCCFMLRSILSFEWRKYLFVWMENTFSNICITIQGKLSCISFTFFWYSLKQFFSKRNLSEHYLVHIWKNYYLNSNFFFRVKSLEKL